jgi:hypothetical protein
MGFHYHSLFLGEFLLQVPNNFITIQLSYEESHNFPFILGELWRLLVCVRIIIEKKEKVKDI